MKFSFLLTGHLSPIYGIPTVQFYYDEASSLRFSQSLTAGPVPMDQGLSSEGGTSL
jgi:hypothetical protein